MLTKNKILMLATMGVIAHITPASAQTYYQCMACPAGYDCSSGKLNACPSGYLCFNGKKFLKSSCKKSIFVSFATAKTGNTVLSSGYYEVEVAGAGGGGGGGVAYGACKCHNGSKGGNGALNTYSFFIEMDRILNYTVGGGGSGGCSNHGCDGNPGGESKFSINVTSGNSSGSAAAGGGGRGNKEDQPGSNAGNGNGGTGGNRGGCSGAPSCNGKGGGNGNSGWITIYKYAC